MEMVDMAYRYESLDKQGVLEEEEEDSDQEDRRKKWKFEELGSLTSEKDSKKSQVKDVTCLNCHVKGHYINQWPRPRRKGPKERKKKVQKSKKKNYNQLQPIHFVKEGSIMKKVEEAQFCEIVDEPSTFMEVKRKDVLEGTLSINNLPVKVLFDTGASHSFISSKVVEKLGLQPRFNKGPCAS